MTKKVISVILIIGVILFIFIISYSIKSADYYGYLHNENNINNIKEIEFITYNKTNLDLGRVMFKVVARNELHYLIEAIKNTKQFNAESGGESVFIKFKCLNRPDILLNGYLDYNNGILIITLEPSLGIYEDRYVKLRDRHYWDVIRNYYIN